MTVVDYGLGNLLSVKRGLEVCGAQVEISSDPKKLMNSKRIVFPGVGAFPDAMKRLHDLDLVTALREVASSGIPVLAICLGMQLLMEESEEFVTTQGLGLIPGKVIQVPSHSKDNVSQKVPIIGWSQLTGANFEKTFKSTLLEDVTKEDSFYFVHSFMCQTERKENLLATIDYGGHSIPAVIRHQNIVGAQFHPEKSGRSGLKILRRFIS